ncbi:hypothetical protein GWI33_022988 [Rhynchophorus ferrugineus]|uniref:Uncharacterized protein n=1 Tax=Rhynchophorus ferrugineus TaxID=354439 RepID=A0A834IZY2_RHYFE|nr:hypothetical protein GWI33_022988 [Rhynchophorus ferrugineus]
MLSYMLPVEEKPPPVPKNHLQLSLAHQAHNGHHAVPASNGPPPLVNGKSLSTPISKETSISSFISDTTTATASHSSMTPTSTSTDKGKPKLVINGGKHQTLKRVSFGSSKGSMVETLIFESPLQEEPEPSPIPENGREFPNGCDKDSDYCVSSLELLTSDVHPPIACTTRALYPSEARPSPVYSSPFSSGSPGDRRWSLASVTLVTSGE